MRSGKHLKYVASLCCMICHNPESQAHHLLMAEPRGMGLKTGDEWTVPLCFKHHSELHKNGNEIKFFKGYGWNYERVKGYAKLLSRKNI